MRCAPRGSPPAGPARAARLPPARSTCTTRPAAFSTAALLRRRAACRDGSPDALSLHRDRFPNVELWELAARVKRSARRSRRTRTSPTPDSFAEYAGVVRDRRRARDPRRATTRRPSRDPCVPRRRRRRPQRRVDERADDPPSRVEPDDPPSSHRPRRRARATSSRSPSTASTTGAATATRYVPDGDRWLFAHRSVRTDGRTPGGWAAGRTAG